MARHFTTREYREAADYIVENEDTATAANMLRCAADDLDGLVKALAEAVAVFESGANDG